MFLFFFIAMLSFTTPVLETQGIFTSNNTVRFSIFFRTSLLKNIAYKLIDKEVREYYWDSIKNCPTPAKI